jgi:putative transposase
MNRILRPHLPGFAFHLTTRLQGRAHLFTPPLRWQVLRLLRQHLRRSDVQLLAYVVMTNHLHLVVVQGAQPLWYLMQPFLRSVALAVKRVHSTEGHVFGRRYAHRVCHDARHLRNAIAYVHANPVRAGLAPEPALYRWSSYPAYIRPGRLHMRPDTNIRLGLESFRDEPMSGNDERLRALHSIHVATAQVAAVDPLPPGVRPRKGTDNLLPTSQLDESQRIHLPHELALNIVHDSAPDIVLEDVRSRWGRRRLTDVRRRIALAASRHGFRGGEIAAYLRLSEPSISRLLAYNKAAPQKNDIECSFINARS